MKHDPIGGALVILFVAIAAFSVCEIMSAPSKPVLEASGAQQSPILEDLAKGGFTSMTRFGVWSNGTNCEGVRVILCPATNVLFAFHDKPTCPEFTNGVWVIRFQP